MISEWKTAKNKKGEEYSVKLVFDDSGRLSEASGCTCKWGSWHRYEEKNKEKKWMCRHIVRAYAEVVKINPSLARENLIKMEIMDKNHLRRI